MDGIEVLRVFAVPLAIGAGAVIAGAAAAVKAGRWAGRMDESISRLFTKLHTHATHDDELRRRVERLERKIDQVIERMGR